MKLNLKTLYNLNPKEQLILAAVILFITGYLVYIVIIPPALSQYRIAKRQFSVQQSLLEARKKKTGTLSRMKDSFKDLKVKISEKKNSFFTQREVHDFLKELDTWAKDTGNSLVSIKPASSDIIGDSGSGEPDQHVCYRINVVEVKLKGSYNHILKLLDRFSKYKKVLGISRLDLKMLKDNTPQLDAQFNLNLYSLDKK
ncbi:MAG: hypothetical protein ABH844_06945 [Candidatus Omnitrophota bacterium]